MGRTTKRITDRAERINRLPLGHVDRISLLKWRRMPSSMLNTLHSYKPTEEEEVILQWMGLINAISVPYIEPDMAQLTALVEKWDVTTNTFKLPTGEITVTLEDVYRILHVPICGQKVFQRNVPRGRYAKLTEWLTGSPPSTKDRNDNRGCFVGDALQNLPDSNYRIRLIIAVIISYLIYPENKGRDLFPWALVDMVQRSVEQPQRRQYAWGKTILAHLYRDLRRCIVSNGVNIRQAPFLQIWAFEHIKIIRPPGRPYDTSDAKLPYLKRWTPYDGLCCERFDVEYWRNKFRCLHIREIVWCPYDEFVGWPEDSTELESVRDRGELYCRDNSVEKYLPEMVQKQFSLTPTFGGHGGNELREAVIPFLSQRGVDDLHDLENHPNRQPDAAAPVLPPVGGEGSTVGVTEAVDNMEDVPHGRTGGGTVVEAVDNMEDVPHGDVPVSPPFGGDGGIVGEGFFSIRLPSWQH